MRKKYYFCAMIVSVIFSALNVGGLFDFAFSESDPMIFTRLSFWLFFLVVMGVYAMLYRRLPLRNAFLFVVSVYFYYKCGGFYFVLLLASVVGNYFFGLLISPRKRKSSRKAVLTLGLFFNLLMLCYFKYAYLFVGWFNELTGASFEVRNLLAKWSNGLTGSHFDVSNIILPVGISFFTFQAISYLVDVYRRQAPALRNIIDFGFYLSFFPQLVAGPIVRAADFIPQLHRDYLLRRNEAWHAFYLISCGLIKKMMISDYISIHFVDRVFDQPMLYTGIENLLACYGYALQIYCDFSGYTDIAIGVALLLGFRLPINFNSSYCATDISDFWRRWHISLSTWLRDYLYIPLGGNRKGAWRTSVNLLVTMLLGGLWHGANLRFVVWGGLHGLGLLVNKQWRRLVPASQSRLRRFLGALVTFHFVVFCWIFFRADSMDAAVTMIGRIFTATPLPYIADIIAGYSRPLALIAFGYIIHWLPHNWKTGLRRCYIESPLPVKFIAAIAMVFILCQVKSAVIQPFVYFQF